MDKDFKGFYFKTKVILIDDNESFLNNVSFKLSDNYNIATYSNPDEAIDYINSSYKNNLISTTENFLEEIEDEDDEIYYSVDFPKIVGLAENPSKSDTISVVIVDYSMPSINGIELCKKISHLPILKIMLTGHADFRIAVDAFNNGIIDRFLVKDTEFMMNDLVKEINTMQEIFFEKLSYPLLTCFSAKKETVVTQSEYITHLKKLIAELNIIEFYLLNSQGSYLLMDNKGTRHYFIVLLNHQLDEYIDLAQSMQADTQLINKIANKTHAPIFIDEIDYKVPVSDWDYLLHPIKKAHNYYYCLVSEEI